MAKNKSNSQGLTPEEVKSELALLKNSYDMYEKSKEETEFVMKNRLDKNGNRKYSDSRLSDTMKLMQIMQDDIERKYVELGGNIEELKAKKRGRKSGDSRKKLLTEILKKEKERATLEAMKELKENDIRVTVDDSLEKLGYRMRNSITMKTPYTLVIGDKEKEIIDLANECYSSLLEHVCLYCC